MNTEDPRKTGLKNGLRQLTIEQLERVIKYPQEMCLDTYNYDEQNKTYCPLAVALELHRIPNPTNEKITNHLLNFGYKIQNTKGIEGEYYTTNRKEDLILAAKEIIQEKQDIEYFKKNLFTPLEFPQFSDIEHFRQQMLNDMAIPPDTK